MFLFYSLLLLLYTSASLGQIEIKEANDSTFLLPTRNIETIVFSVTVKDAKYDNISRRAKLNGWKNKTNNWTTTKRWNIVFGQNRRWLSRSEVVCLFFHFNGCYQLFFTVAVLHGMSRVGSSLYFFYKILENDGGDRRILEKSTGARFSKSSPSSSWKTTMSIFHLFGCWWTTS